MSQEAREWLGLVIAVFAGTAFVSLLVCIQAQSRGRSRGQVLRTIALVWGAMALTVVAGWLLYLHLGGPVFELQSSGGLRFLVRSLSGAQIALVSGLLVGLVALYVGAMLAVRGLLGASPPGETQVTVQPTTRSDEQ